MLVMATMYIGTSSALPETSYVKMIDVWMIFCLAIPFFQVLIRTTAEAFRDEQPDKIKSDLTKWAKTPAEIAKADVAAEELLVKRARIRLYLRSCGTFTIPIFVAAFIVVYFAFGNVKREASRNEANMNNF